MTAGQPDETDEKPEKTPSANGGDEDDILIVDDVDDGARASLLEEIEAERSVAQPAATEEPAPEPAGSSGDLRSELLRAREAEAAARERSLRALADYENLRRRTQREKDEYSRSVLGNFLREILPVLDNLETALSAPAATADSPDHFRAGVELIGRQMRDVLSRMGLSEVPGEGAEFDPAIHEAVARRETTDSPANSVVRVMRKGYRLHDRLLRAALVEVAVRPETADGDGESREA